MVSKPWKSTWDALFWRHQDTVQDEPPTPRVEPTGPGGPTSAAAFRAWLYRMGDAGLSGRECARRLGCSANSIAAWREGGAPRYVGLACAAVEAGLEAIR